MSAHVCGCDPEARPLAYFCLDFPLCAFGRTRPPSALSSDFSQPLTQGQPIPTPPAKGARPGIFPPSAAGRKEYPIFTGLIMYFPDACAAVAHVSMTGNKQHNPGEPMHWARGKSMDQTDTTVRHMMDNASGAIKDTDGEYHLAKAAWRLLAELQLTIEKEQGR